MIHQQAKTYAELTENFIWQIPEEFNIATACVTRWSESTPERTALIIDKEEEGIEKISFDHLNRLSNQFANTFVKLGVKTGDRVAILLSQQVETAAAHLACFKIGAISVPLFVLFGQDALTYRLSDSGARILVTGKAVCANISTVGFGAEKLEHVISIDGPAEDTLDWLSLKHKASDQFEDLATKAEDPATLIYTSGTTGSPKGALHAHRVLLGHLPGVQLPQNMFPKSGDLFWTPADWAWIGGLLDVLLPSLYFGVPVLAKRFAKFSADQAFDLIEKHSVRNLFLPPTVLKMMMKDAPDRKVKVRSLGSGGETLGVTLQEWAEKAFGVGINEFFGQTECNLIVSNCQPLFPAKVGSMGKAVAGFKVAIIDETGSELPAGERGNIVVKCPNPTLMLKYWNKPEATKAKFIGDWMLTGDIGYQDQGGYFWYVARDDDVITSAGYRIGPGEIEDCLMQHPSVSLAAVVGVVDALRTEIVTAFVVLNSLIDEMELKNWVKAKVGQHLYPRRIHFIDEIPTTATGKIRRGELRRLGTELGSDSG